MEDDNYGTRSARLIAAQLLSVPINLEMATPPSNLSFALLIVGVLFLSCNGANLSRPKRTVELIQGATNFLFR